MQHSDAQNSRELRHSVIFFWQMTA